MKKFICAELLLLFMLIIPQNISASNWVNTHLLDQKGNAIYVDDDSIHKINSDIFSAWCKVIIKDDNRSVLFLIYFNPAKMSPPPKYIIAATALRDDKNGKILFQEYTPPALYQKWKTIRNNSKLKKIFDHAMSKLDSKKD